MRRGIRFNAISMNTETVLKVAIADIHSHRNNCLTVDDGADCDRHMKTVTSFALSDEWAEVELPLTDFVDKVIDGVNDRSSDLDLTQVFALTSRWIQTTKSLTSTWTISKSR